MTLAVMVCGIAIFFVVVGGGTRVLGRVAARAAARGGAAGAGCRSRRGRAADRSPSRVYLGRFDRLFGDQTIFAGVTYTDAHVTLTGLLVVVGRARRSARLIALVNAVAAPRVRWLVAAVVPAVVCYLVVGARRLVRQQLHREAERARARAARTSRTTSR